jgi:hypothetical protein
MSLFSTLKTRCRAQAGRERRPPFHRASLYSIGFELPSAVIEVISVVQQEFAPGGQLLAVVTSWVRDSQHSQENGKHSEVNPMLNIMSVRN